MSTLVSEIETKVRLRLDEPTARFWSSNELVGIIGAGIYDLWRPMVDLKQEYFLTVDITNVSLAANSSVLTGIPADVHKVYMIEPRDISQTSTARDLQFLPEEYNSTIFEAARSTPAIVPEDDVVYYAVSGSGGPAGTPIIRVAPQISTALNLAFAYVPTLGAIASVSTVPLPGEVDNALVAWTVAYARAKEREDRAPDAGWLSIYASEKANLLQSLGTRNLHKPLFAEALFKDNW